MFFTIIVGGTVMILLSIPLYLQKIGPNGLYGFRVKKTLENPELWYPVNKYASVGLMFTGVAMIIAAIGLLFVPGLGVDTYSLACAAVLTVASMVTIVMTMRYMNTL